MTTSVVLYARLSKEDEQHNGVSIENQLERLHAYAKSQGWDVAGEYVDRGQSGKTINRPAMNRLRADVAAGTVQAVAFLKLDKLGRSRRNVEDLLAEFEQHGVAAVSLQESLDTSTAMGRFTLGLIASLAELERETIVERTRSALEYLRRQGKHIGAVPFGYMVDGEGRLVENPTTMPWLLKMKQWRRKGYTFREIVSKLDEAGVPTRTRKDHPRKWSARAVQLILRRHAKVKRTK